MLSFQNAMNKFYIRCEAMGISQKTMTTYRWEFKKFNEYLVMKKIKDIELLTADDIRGYIAYMRSKGYSPVTIQDRWKGLRTLFKYLHTDGLIIFNPIAGIPKPKVPKIRARTFTATELQKLLGYFNEDDGFISLRNKLALYTFFGCGIRKNELLQLSIFQLHLDMSFMTIIGKGDKERDVPLSNTLLKLLRKYLKARATYLLDIGVETSAVFVTKRGTPMTDSCLRQVFKDMKEGTGITGRRVSPHTLRHSFAKAFLASSDGSGLPVLQKILGHESLSTTELYLHYGTDEITQQMKKYCPLDNGAWSYLNS